MDEEKVKTFLYILMRDTIACGHIEHIMREFIGTPMSTSLSGDPGFEFQPGEFSNKFLEAHVLDIISRLK
jgi:hypothetical protein